jgi:hypothetical protein
MEINCVICNKIVSRKPCEVAKRINIFCSQKCYAVEKSRRWKENSNPRFSGGNLKKICQHCKKEFISKRYGNLRNEKIVACSLKCGNILAGKKRTKENHWAWNGGLGRITKPIRAKKKYKDWMRSILEKYNYTCVKCNSTEDVEVHHKKELAIMVKEYLQKHNTLDPYDEYFYKVNNGIILCRKCHITQHTKRK